MSEKPIIFSGPMVQALLDDRKTQTRRVIKPQPEVCTHDGIFVNWSCKKWPNLTVDTPDDLVRYGPYQAGQTLWVRETWAHDAPSMDDARRGVESCGPFGVYYRATEIAPETLRWRSSRFMPRWASRITLEITGIRVERIQDISEADARAEGCLKAYAPDYPGLSNPFEWTHRADFAVLWDSLNAKRPGCSWADNPYCWVLEFKRL